MGRTRRRWAGVILGLLFSGNIAWAESAPLMTGKGRLGVDLEGELSSRDMKVDGQKDRERVTRQAVELSYGLLEQLDLYAKVGLGNITFEEADLDSRMRPLSGIGFRSSALFGGGYFAGVSAQYQFGKVSTFDQNNSTLALEDRWSEADARLFIGSKDLIRDPEPDLRFYTGVRFSSRNDKRTSENQPGSKLKQDSSLGGIIGMDFSDRKIFRIDTELGTGDCNNVMIRVGLLF
ncbi:MAG TPA: hypothetical protein VLY20_03210 [Nitrospiria bacterium]|nr:hypothetical protein [Nitrospiria bacterium]HUK55648.1 hypothetical protein [Nitrospiria bacterium]